MTGTSVFSGGYVYVVTMYKPRARLDDSTHVCTRHAFNGNYIHAISQLQSVVDNSITVVTVIMYETISHVCAC